MNPNFLYSPVWVFEKVWFVDSQRKLVDVHSPLELNARGAIFKIRTLFKWRPFDVWEEMVPSLEKTPLRVFSSWGDEFIVTLVPRLWRPDWTLISRQIELPAAITSVAPRYLAFWSLLFSETQVDFFSHFAGDLDVTKEWVSGGSRDARIVYVMGRIIFGVEKYILWWKREYLCKWNVFLKPFQVDRTVFLN